MKVLMVGVDQSTRGGMWTVVENYLNNEDFCKETNLKYIPTSITGSKRKRILFTAKAYIKIIFELSKTKYDIVHIHASEKGSIYRKNVVATLAKFFHCKVILHMHGAEFETWYKTSSKKSQQRVQKFLAKGDKIIILGFYWKNFMVSLVDDPKKIFTLYNAVSLPVDNPYNHSAQNLLFLGVIGKRKGIYDLLEAMKTAIPHINPDICLWIYGPDPELIIENLIHKMNLNDRVKYMGWLSTSEKAQIFSNISINILPSYNEGLPMTILETMAYGIPNIATSIAAIPEVIDYDNGILIKPGDVTSLSNAIVFLCNNPEVKASKSTQAYQTIKNCFSLSLHISQLLSLYRELI